MVKINEEYNQSQLPSMTHGAYHFLATGMKPCNKCDNYSECPHARVDGTCTYLERFMDQKEREIMALPHIKPEDRDIVRFLVQQYAAAGIIGRFIGREGLIVKNGRHYGIQPVMKAYWTCVGHIVRLSDRLGLNPAARATLGLDKIAGNFDLALEVQKVSEVEDGKTNDDNTGEDKAV